MFGLTFEKLLIIAVIAAIIVGPAKLPVYAAKLADFVRAARTFIESSRARVEEEVGVPLRAEQWQQELRQYDPRRIIRDALQEPGAPAGPAVPSSAASTAEPRAVETAAQTPPHDGQPSSSLAAAPRAASGDDGPNTMDADADAPAVAPATRQRWTRVGGSSGHPRRVLVTEAVEPAAAAAPETPAASAEREPAPSGAEASVGDPDTELTALSVTEREEAGDDAAAGAPATAPAAVPATRQRWARVGGSSGHPRRVLITEPAQAAAQEPAA